MYSTHEIELKSRTHRSHLRFILEGFEGIGVLLFALCSWPVSKHWLKQWGSRSEEREQTWPGDELVSACLQSYTRAIDIAASADSVWKWVVQLHG